MNKTKPHKPGEDGDEMEAEAEEGETARPPSTTKPRLHSFLPRFSYHNVFYAKAGNLASRCPIHAQYTLYTNTMTVLKC